GRHRNTVNHDANLSRVAYIVSKSGRVYDSDDEWLAAARAENWNHQRPVRASRLMIVNDDNSLNIFCDQVPSINDIECLIYAAQDDSADYEELLLGNRWATLQSDNGPWLYALNKTRLSQLANVSITNII